MKILKAGHVRSPATATPTLLRGTCERCGCQVECDKTEALALLTDNRRRLYGTVLCPTDGCGTVIPIEEHTGKIGAPAAPAVESRR